jgi:hypothetical protein
LEKKRPEEILMEEKNKLAEKLDTIAECTASCRLKGAIK